jgi:hypothetical protein
VQPKDNFQIMADFIELAEGSRWLLERYLGGGSDNDDFVNLEATPGHAHNGGGSDNILQSTMYDESSSPDATPFLSKSAEAELYLLCTNFLLYVAMVIITTIIAKIYFPESLERDASAPAMRRKYSYRRQTVQQQPSYADEEDDEMEALYSDDEEEEDGSGDHSGNNNNDHADFPPQHTPTYHSPQRDPLGLGATSPQSGMRVVDIEEEDALLSSLHTPRGVTARLSARVLEFDQETTSKAKVLQRLLFCCLMLNVTFVTWGALQERVSGCG